MKEVDTTVIRPTSGWAALNFREIWRYRELLYFLAWRDVKVRYKQTAIGALWAVIQPAGMMLVFTLFFSRLAGITSGDIPYPIFTLAALLPWQLFALGLTQASTSLVVNERLVSKVYFPRILVPSAAVFAGLIDLAIAFILFLVLMLYYGIVPTIATLMLPLFVLLALATTLGVSYWLSALDVEYRDVRYTIPFLVQVWIFATPVFYSSEMLPDNMRIFYSLNPMTGVIEGFRWALLGQAAKPDQTILISIGVALFLLVSGVFYFRRMERTMADIV